MEIIMLSWYASIMDSSRNPLRNLPPAQRFQAMLILSMMWTAIFCAATSAWIWVGEIVIAHLLLALGTLITASTFRAANRTETYRDHPAKDGTNRYDDVWGA